MLQPQGCRCSIGLLVGVLTLPRDGEDFGKIAIFWFDGGGGFRVSVQKSVSRLAVALLCGLSIITNISATINNS